MKTIAVYDFDGTLCKSAEPTQENKDLWEKVNGRPWPHKGNGWWSKDESLCIKTFNPQLIEWVKKDALDRIEDFDTYTVLLTGRIGKFSAVVKEILRLNGLPYFDAYYFNDSDSTLKFKLRVLNELSEMYPEAKTFEMWEDRVEHIPHFAEWGMEKYGTNFKMNIV